MAGDRRSGAPAHPADQRPLAGDHETAACGNALAADLGRWARPSDGNYWEAAHRSCTSRRIDRIGKAVGVLSLTVLAVTLLAARTRRRAEDGLEN